jgi:hypothetical protein
VLTVPVAAFELVVLFQGRTFPVRAEPGKPVEHLRAGVAEAIGAARRWCVLEAGATDARAGEAPSHLRLFYNSVLLEDGQPGMAYGLARGTPHIRGEGERMQANEHTEGILIAERSSDAFRS